MTREPDMRGLAIPIPDSAVATCASPAGAAYRGKAGCRDIRCTRDGHPDRCYGWHCLFCDGPSNGQGNCANPHCPGPDRFRS